MDLFDLPLTDVKAERFSEEQVAAFALRTGWIDDIGVINPASTVVEKRELTWWPAHELIIARDPIWGTNVAAWVLKEGGRLVRLDGTSPPIHQLNSQVPPALSTENALAYLGFFCTFVHGESEENRQPFMLVRSLNEGLLPDDIDEETLSTFIREPQILKVERSANDNEKFDYHAEVLVYYASALFVSNFIVKSTGMVEMVEDEPLAADLGKPVNMPLRFEESDASPVTSSNEGDTSPIASSDQQTT